MAFGAATELDLWDKRILYELDGDSRLPFSAIGASLSRSPQWVKYRIERLRTLGVIKHLYPLVDYSALSQIKAGLLIRLAESEPAKEIAFLNSCYKDRCIQCIYRTEGEYDLYLGVFTKDIDSLAEFIDSFKIEHGTLIANIDISIERESCQFRRNYLLGAKAHAMGEIVFGNSTALAGIDVIDRQVVDCLNSDPRMGVVDISRSINQSKDVALYHLRKIQKVGVIKGYSVQMNPRHFPYQSYVILLKIAGMDEKKRQELFSFCRLSGKVVRISRALGAYDFMLEAEVAGRDEFRWFHKELVHRFHPSIRSSMALSIYSLDKYRTYPTGILGD